MKFKYRLKYFLMTVSILMASFILLKVDGVSKVIYTTILVLLTTSVLSNYYIVKEHYIERYFFFIKLSKVCIMDIMLIEKINLINTNNLLVVSVGSKQEDFVYRAKLYNGQEIRLPSHFFINNDKLSVPEYIMRKYMLPVKNTTKYEIAESG